MKQDCIYQWLQSWFCSEYQTWLEYIVEATVETQVPILGHHRHDSKYRVPFSLIFYMYFGSLLSIARWKRDWRNPLSNSACRRTNPSSNLKEGLRYQEWATEETTALENGMWNQSRLSISLQVLTGKARNFNQNYGGHKSGMFFHAQSVSRLKRWAIKRQF